MSQFMPPKNVLVPLTVLVAATLCSAADPQPAPSTGAPSTSTTAEAPQSEPSAAASQPKKSGKKPKPNDGPVYTDPDAVDTDYAFQGEYRGWQRPLKSVRSTESVGLHVIALGNGEFQGVKYYGGLPGAGWQQDGRYLLNGKLRGQRVELLGDQSDIVIENGVATLLTHQGERIGELQRVERVSPTLGAAPPPGAIVLFDGSNTNQFVDAKLTPDGLLMAGTDTNGAWNDFRLHGEFRLPYKPQARGQSRGNSGFYLQNRYEVQVLDSFGLEGIENECASVYKTRRPNINMCLPPLQWQTYDMEFHAPRFDASGKKVQDMTITLWHNGVLVHNNQPIPNKTGAGKQEAPEPLPIKLQDHANPVVYRNIWLVDLAPSVSGNASPLPISATSGPTPIAWYPPYPYPPPLPVTMANGSLVLLPFAP
ncbi:MAG: DUF1080 domain-containing protein [Planctomycetaceae bacterium]